MQWPLSHAERFWSRVDQRGDDECWPWLGAVQSAGYGHLWFPDRSRTVLAHRVAYALAHGEVSDLLVIDHLCESTTCCNPAHLEAVPQGVNLTRANGKRTLCPHGHELDGIRRERNRRGLVFTTRYCLTCNRERSRLHRSKKRGDAHA